MICADSDSVNTYAGTNTYSYAQNNFFSQPQREARNLWIQMENDRLEREQHAQEMERKKRNEVLEREKRDLVFHAGGGDGGTDEMKKLMSDYLAVDKGISGK